MVIKFGYLNYLCYIHYRRNKKKNWDGFLFNQSQFYLLVYSNNVPSYRNS